MGLVSEALWGCAACSLAVWLALALARYVRWRLYWHRALSPFPGPRVSLPLLGTLLYIVGPMSTVLRRGLRLMERHGNEYITFWLGERPWLHIIRPEDVEGLLSSSKHLHKPDIVYGPVSGFFGRGLITINGDAWRRHRRVLTPAFHFAVLERYSGIFTRRAEAFAKGLASVEAEGRSFDFMPHIGAFVTDTVMETAFGLVGGDEDLEGKEKADFIQATDRAFQIIAGRVIQPWLMVESLFRLSPYAAQQRQADKVINQYASRVIDKKRRQIIERKRNQLDSGAEQENDDDKDDIGIRKKLTFLDLVLGQDTDALSDQEVLEEVRTLIAVQQTSASTLSFAAVCLALHPEAQRLAREEVLAVDAVEGLEPLERLNRLKYVERFLKEVLRLYPITAIFSRTLGEDHVLHNAKTKTGTRSVTLPAGLGITFFVYQTHRDPRHWPEPERFDPDRFLPEQCAGRHPYAYVPFSAGPRNCIGQRYAMLQMKAVLAALLRTVELSPGKGCERQDKLDININTFLYIKGGFNVRLRKLDTDWHGCWQR